MEAREIIPSKVQVAADKYRQALKNLGEAGPEDKDELRNRALKMLDKAVAVTEVSELQEKA